MSRKIKMGMIGGGRGAFIGAVHRMAAGIDGQIEFVAGALDVNPEIAILSGQDLFLSPWRTYGTYQEMIEKIPRCL
jgi:predicted dehydrogenase